MLLFRSTNLTRFTAKVKKTEEEGENLPVSPSALFTWLAVGEIRDKMKDGKYVLSTDRLDIGEVNESTVQWMRVTTFSRY